MNRPTLKFLIVALVSIATLSSCRTADDQVKQDAVIQGQENSNAADRADKAIALEMEHDLARRQRLYQGLAGRFFGSIPSSTSPDLHIEMTLFPGVPPYRGQRIRTRDEILHDLDRLEFKISLRVYAGTASHFACVFQSVTPDETTGEILLASDDCFYSISIRPTDSTAKKPNRSLDEIGTQLTQQLYDGKINRTPMLYFDAVSTRNGLLFQTGLDRK